MAEPRSLTSLQVLAKQLGIPERLITSHIFMVHFKGFVGDICRFAENDSQLKNILNKKRVDLNLDVSLDYEEIVALLEEIKARHFKVMSEHQAQNWMDRNHGYDYDVRSAQTISISQAGEVTFHEARVHGAETHLGPLDRFIETKYKTNDSGEVMEDFYVHDTKSIADSKSRTQTIWGVDGKKRASKHISYDTMTGNIEHETTYDGKGKPFSTKSYYPDGSIKATSTITYLDDGHTSNHEIRQFSESGINTAFIRSKTVDGKLVSQVISHLNPDGSVKKIEEKRFDKDGNEIKLDSSTPSPDRLEY